MEKWGGFGTALVLWGQNKGNSDPKKLENIPQASVPVHFTSPHSETIASSCLKLAEPDQALALVPQYLILVCHVLIPMANCCLPV